MTKIERVKRALRGEEVDRPPVSFWYHFGLQHMPGRKHAEAQIGFYKAYDLDFLKVMSDYPYPLPDSVGELETADDWRRVEPLDGGHPAWQQQLDALSLIFEAIGSEAMFIETIFSPWTTARRLTRNGSLAEARSRHPEALLVAMANIATSLANYSREAIARGASGIFLSLGAANNETMSAAEYEVWGRPFDLRVLDSVNDAPFNVLHIHGKKIHFDSVLDYPVAAINWSHFSTPPSLAEGRRMSGLTVMGGIDEANASHSSAPEIRAQAEQSIREVGSKGLILTPGCSVPTDTPERNLRAIKAAAESWSH